MTPAARVQAAIELLDGIIDAARSKGAPADRVISAYFKERRYAGSKDRRAVRELVYRAVRLCGPVPQSGRSAMIALAREDEALAPLFDGSTHGAQPIDQSETAAETGLAEKWLVQRLMDSGIDDAEATALLGRAALDIRVNALKADRSTLALPDPAEPLAGPQALRLEPGAAVDRWDVYREGLIEVQDLGSQWVCEAVPANAGDTIVDLCAGAGGKTLGLAARFGNAVSLVACDTDKRRLGNLAPRAARAGAQVDHTVLLDPGREMEALSPWQSMAQTVLVDAPCSGSGTWRRNPESRWRLDTAELERLTRLQDHVLDLGAQLVSPGGALVFVTCSLLDEEGTERVEAFLSRNEGWRAARPEIPVGRERGAGIRLTPYRDGTDGFFIAIMRSSC